MDLKVDRIYNTSTQRISAKKVAVLVNGSMSSSAMLGVAVKLNGAENVLAITAILDTRIVDKANISKTANLAGFLDVELETIDMTSYDLSDIAGSIMEPSIIALAALKAKDFGAGTMIIPVEADPVIAGREKQYNIFNAIQELVRTNTFNLSAPLLKKDFININGAELLKELALNTAYSFDCLNPNENEEDDGYIICNSCSACIKNTNQINKILTDSPGEPNE